MSQSPEEAMEEVKRYAEEHGRLPAPEQWSAELSLNSPKMLEAGNWETLEKSPYRKPEILAESKGSTQ